MKNTARSVVEKMFAAFSKSDVEGSGRAHPKIKRSGKELKHEWVQVYTVRNDLITRMEAFATSEVAH